jgi:hypothetical protein
MKIIDKYYITKGFNILNIILSVLLLLICTGNIYSQRITADGNKFCVYGKEIFINGVNTPWDNWNDFGGNYDPNFWNTEFQEIRQAGGNASRIWITCNGDVGINISTTGLVSGATTAHWEDLDDMFALAEEHQVYIMATLTSFDHTKNTYVKYQRWRNMLADTANVSSYVNTYVIPFINRFKNNPYLWCVDICNEIEWMHENSECGNIPWDRLQYFAARVAAAVHENSDVLVTLGSAAVKWNSDSPGCEGNFWSDQSLQAQYNSPQAFLDFYSPHFYGWVVRWFGNFAVDKTPDDYGINDRPCMVGENPATGVYTQNSSGQNVLVVPISEAYIKTYQQGWKGLMVWTSNGVDGNGSLADCGVGLTAFQNQYPGLVSPGSPCLFEGITFLKTDITCHGNSDGSVNLSVSGTGTFDFKWSTGDTIQNIQNLDKGWYKVMVTDSSGCSMIDSIEILEPKLLVLQSDYSEYICPGTTNGYINLNPSGGAPPYTYTWSNGKINQNISNLSQGIYSVIVKDQNKCQVSDSFEILVILPYDNQEICLVTFDPQTGKNLIIWEKTQDPGIKSYNIYREDNLIGTSGGSESPGYFIDTIADPASRAYLYTISIIDTCGYESIRSSPHKIMFLQQTIGLNEINLNWSKYEGFEVEKYNIWRGPDINNMSLLANVSGETDMFTDNSPLDGINIYQLEAVSPHSCNPDTSDIIFNSSFSYLPDESPEGIKNLTRINTIDIFQNPFNDYTILNFDNPDGFPYILYVMDLSGKVCRISDDIKTSEYLLERGDLSQGFYFIELRGNNIYRARIIIE